MKSTRIYQWLWLRAILVNLWWYRTMYKWPDCENQEALQRKVLDD